MSTLYRHAPGTIWRRALARTDRRSRAILTARATLRDQGIDPDAVTLTHEYELLRQAARLSNVLASIA